MKTIRRTTIAVATLIALASPWGIVHADLTLTDGWVREAPPGSRVLGAYVSLENDGAEDRRIVEVTSPQFDRIELHRTVVVDDEARMEQQPHLDIPAAGTLIMEPGGDHLMLFGPEARLEAGMEIDVTLRFADDTNETYALEVRRVDGSDAGGHDHHGGHSGHHHH